MTKHNPKELLSKINKAKAEIKKTPQIKELCEEYKVSIDFIDYIPTMFKDLDVSARTEKGIIYLSYKLLEDGFNKNFGYLIHEYTHFFQQCFNDKPTKSSDDGEYLKNPYEQEAFKNQIDYIEDEFGSKESKKYVNHLLEYHEVEDEDKQEIKEELT